jgi:hypothetical protein
MALSVKFGKTAVRDEQTHRERGMLRYFKNSYIKFSADGINFCYIEEKIRHTSYASEFLPSTFSRE